jgi:hypothetical protein
VTMLDNARAVVTTWRRGDHVKAWASPAIGLPPSTLTYAWADELQRLSAACDDAANRLRLLGYLPSHSSMRELRSQASVWASAANRSRQWGAALLEAESELSEAAGEAEASAATRSPEPSPS